MRRSEVQSYLKASKTLFLCLVLSLGYFSIVNAQQSVAREWNDVMLEAIRKDFARPTVHSRNLFHISAGMYDAWAAYDSQAQPYILGDSIGGVVCEFT
ncbi:MAG: hypothetical protein HRT72_09015, partial [Flavobacteriales bacterium]|nr:hypothetical protein [Flavobacteriales bacterium]